MLVSTINSFGRRSVEQLAPDGGSLPPKMLMESNAFWFIKAAGPGHLFLFKGSK